MANILEIFGRDAHQMTLRLLEAANPSIPAGASVALKPNLVVAAAAHTGATTHPGVLSGAIEYLKTRGIAHISVIEGSWVGDSTLRAYRAAGYDRVCEAYGVPFYDLKKDATRTVKTAIGDMELCARALDADVLINLPVLKGHCQTVMTCALKNLKGCLPDREKRRFHALGLTRPIGALGAFLKPALTIVDSLCGDLDFEEGGTPVETNRMYLTADPVLADAYGCRLMGLSLADVPYIGLAEQWGGGSTRWDDSQLVRLNGPTEAAGYPRPSGKVAGLTQNVQQNNACSACYASLVRALYLTGKGGNIPVAIGQGWRGKAFDGLGIGSCCNCAARQVKGCPPTAEAIAQALK